MGLHVNQIRSNMLTINFLPYMSVYKQIYAISHKRMLFFDFFHAYSYEYVPT